MEIQRVFDGHCSQSRCNEGTEYLDTFRGTPTIRVVGFECAESSADLIHDIDEPTPEASEEVNKPIYFRLVYSS